MGKRSCPNALRKFEVPCRSNDELLMTSKQGILIKNMRSLRCLTVKKSGALRWVTCTSAGLWSFNVRDNDQKIGVGSSLMSIVISPTNDEGKCLSGHASEDVVAATSLLIRLESCVPHSKRQAIYVKKNVGWNDGICHYDLSIDDYRTIGITTFENLSFLLPSENRELCFRESLKIENGQLVESFKRPFYPPNTNITVLCDKGYGFLEYDFAREVKIKCVNEKTRVPNCSKVKESNILRGLLVLGNVMQAIIILSMFTALLVIQSKSKRPSLPGKNVVKVPKVPCDGSTPSFQEEL
jgi:hypothetical protein